MGASLTVKKTAVVLLNLGGPSCLEDVRPFLFRLFYDAAIIPLPNPLRYCVARGLSRHRLKEATAIYQQLGGGSPLLENTQLQAAALEATLGEGFRVFVAMRYAPPFAAETFETVRAWGAAEIVLLPLYPQYSTTTTASAVNAWEKAATATHGWKGAAAIPTRVIDAYPTLDGFLEAMVQLTLPHYQEAGCYGTPRLLLTAHGLPEKTIRRGDPYQRQVEETARHFCEKLSVSLSTKVEVTLCYQSRVGPLKWIGPATDQEIIRAGQDKRPLVVVPIAFVSEHAETLVELDKTYRALAMTQGCPRYARVETVQTHPLFIEALASMVKGDMLIEHEYTLS